MIKPGVYDLDKVLTLREEINRNNAEPYGEDCSFENFHVKGMKLLHKYGMVHDHEVFSLDSYKEYEFKFFNRNIKEGFIIFCGEKRLRPYSAGTIDNMLNVKVKAPEKLYEDTLKPYYDYLISHNENEEMNKDYETLLTLLRSIDSPVNEAILAEKVWMAEEDVRDLVERLIEKGALVRTPVLYHYKANRDFHWGQSVKDILTRDKVEEKLESLWVKFYRKIRRLVYER